MASNGLNCQLFENLSNSTTTSMCSMCDTPRGARVYFVPSEMDSPLSYEVHDDSSSTRSRSNSKSSQISDDFDREDTNEFDKTSHESFDVDDIQSNFFERGPQRSIDRYLRHVSDPSIVSPIYAGENSEYMNIKFEAYKTGDSKHMNCYSCVLPVICDGSNTQFYSQCGVEREGWCCSCCVLTVQNDNNMNRHNSCKKCGKGLAAKYHEWYPNLYKILALPREESCYYEHEDILNAFGIYFDSKRKLKHIINNYLLLRVIFISIPESYREIRALHLERCFMIGVFAGRKFKTTRLTRKFLKGNLKMTEFNRKFPRKLLGKNSYCHNQRILIADKLNREFFYSNVAYFHAHKNNIEGYFDPKIISFDRISAAFDEMIKFC